MSVGVKADPKDFACFGTIEHGHPECEACAFKAECAKKSENKAKK